MRNILRMLIVVLAFGVATPVVAEGKESPKAKVTQSACTSSTYLHLDCATPLAFNWVSYDCCSVIRREGYIRHTDNRVDIYVRAWRNGIHQCRWVIVRGDDFSKYAYYHPSYGWQPGCGGV